MSIKCIIHFNVKNEMKSGFFNIMNNVKSELPLVNGCLGVNIHNSIENPNLYTLVETWETREQHEQHIKNLFDSGQWETINQLLVTDPISGYFNTI